MRKNITTNAMDAVTRILRERFATRGWMLDGMSETSQFRSLVRRNDCDTAGRMLAAIYRLGIPRLLPILAVQSAVIGGPATPSRRSCLGKHRPY
jgi:hypothetical protein